MSFPQSDLTKPLKTIKLPFAIVASQSCDLEQGAKVKDSPIQLETDQNGMAKLDDNGNPKCYREFKPFIPHILILPLFNADLFKSGRHLYDSFDIKSAGYATKEFNKICEGKEGRFHYLKAIPEHEIPDSVIDFKIYFTFPFEALLNNYSQFYVVSLNEMFREFFLQKFSNYLSRIGLPTIEN